MKNSAVDWLVEKLKSQGLLIGEIDNLVAVKQAKEMDEKNLKDSFVAGAEMGEMFNNENRCYVSDADKYYNENFKSE